MQTPRNFGYDVIVRSYVLTLNFSCKLIREMSRYFGGKLHELETAFFFHFLREVAWPVNYININI